MTKTDLRSDLLADLQVAAHTSLPATPAGLPGVAAGRASKRTPSLDVRVTPLRWTRPGLAAPASGHGLGLRFGPVQVSLSL